MSYVIRNIRPSVLHIPDADVRLDSGQTAIVDTLSPQMDELLANRALEAISSDPDPPVATAPVAEESVAAEVTAMTESTMPVGEAPVAPGVTESLTSVDTAFETPDTTTVTEPTISVATVKKTRKPSAPAESEKPDDAQ